ncbi:MAG: hypothetical protein ABI874_07150, partial [Chloroflexota bacterium]
MIAEPPAERAEPSAAASDTEARVPDRVREIREAAQIAQASADTPPPAAPKSSVTAASEPIATAPAANLPAWLRDMTAPQAVPTPTTPTIEAPFVAESVVAAPIADETAALAPSELPDWLKGLAPAAAAAGPSDWPMPDVAVEELPDWLKPSAVPAPAPSEAQAAGLVPGQIPPWLLALRRGGLATIGGDTLETSGLLAGISGALPVESVLALPHTSAAHPLSPAPSAVPETGFAQPTPPRDAVPPPKQKPRWSWRNLLPWLILIAAALAFLPLPFMDSVRGANISGHQPASNFYQTINQVSALRPNSLVLVAFDYSAGARDELDPQAKTTLLHLFENKQRIIAVSFVPTGAQLAQDALTSRNPANTGVSYPYHYGETHLNVGYVSGETAAMKSLAQNFVPSAFTDFRDHDSAGNQPLAKNWQSWDDVDLIIVFSDDGAHIKNWIEQVVRQTDRSPKLLLVGASAAATPTVLPYYDEPIKGFLSGVRGAAEYEGFIAQPATASARLDSTAYVVVVLV